MNHCFARRSKQNFGISQLSSDSMHAHRINVLVAQPGSRSVAARRLVELATTIEAVQDGRIHIGKVNAPFLYMLKASGSEFGAGIKHAVECGWLEQHESGTYVRLIGTSAKAAPAKD
ncbi:hypothetical protein ACKWRH_27980 [Bradyrhizobium sp. Pa8]|uniref:hypothetical protein n=1 Tax=Bradyrhizobium sp. Pa8 TaxID=3386552 RepID=UPI00403F4CAE